EAGGGGRILQRRGPHRRPGRLARRRPGGAVPRPTAHRRHLSRGRRTLAEPGLGLPPGGEPVHLEVASATASHPPPGPPGAFVRLGAIPAPSLSSNLPGRGGAVLGSLLGRSA